MTFSAQQISEIVGGQVIGNGEAQVSDICPIEAGRAGCITFLYDSKYVHFLSTTDASVVLLSKGITLPQDIRPTLILVDNARQAIAQLLAMVAEVLSPRKRGIEQPCFIADGVEISDDSYIGAFAYIGQNVRIGKGVQIYPQAYIGDNCKIGDNCIIYAGAKIYHHCIVGNNCIIHAGAVIGADGFGFETDNAGMNHKVPQIGNVIIEDDVEIGANTTIDRAMIGTTRVKRNAKIDNLVQIAHSVEVGESTFLCSQVGIAGSTKIGSHCILTGQVGVAGHIEVADHVVVGAQSGISNSIRQKGMYSGSPATDAANNRRSIVISKRLPEIYDRLKAVEKEISKLQNK